MILHCLFVWFVLGLLGLFAVIWEAYDGDGPFRPYFGDLIHPIFVGFLCVVAFFLGPLTWIFWLHERWMSGGNDDQ